MAGKDSSSAESRAVANRIAALSNEFDIKLGQKKAYQKQLEEVRRSQDDLKSAARDLRGSLQFIKLEDIDVQIARLEEKLTHTTVDLTEERRLVDQMRDLTKSRSKVAEYQAQVDRIQGDQSLKDDLVKKIQDIDNEIGTNAHAQGLCIWPPLRRGLSMPFRLTPSPPAAHLKLTRPSTNQCLSYSSIVTSIFPPTDAIKAKKEQEKAVLQKLREKEAGKAQDIPSLMTAKQAAYEVTLELREAKKKMIQEFRAKEDEFYARERIWREQQNQARHAQYLQRQAQRDARDAERKFMDDAIKGDPFAEELVLCDQLLAYLARFQVKEDVKEEGSKGPAAELEGMKILRKKLNDDELDGMFAGVGKKGGKGKAPAKKEEAKRDESSARVTHTLDMITAFDRVKVPAPTTRGQAASAFATVEEKKALFAEMQRQELEERKRRRDAGGAEGRTER